MDIDTHTWHQLTLRSRVGAVRRPCARGVVGSGADCGEQRGCVPSVHKDTQTSACSLHVAGWGRTGDHVHEGRFEVEQEAVNREGDAPERARLTEALVKVQ